MDEADVCSKCHGHYHVVDEWLDSEGAARYLRIPVGTLRNLTSNGKIPYRKFGRLNRYFVEELRDFLNRNRRGPYEF